MFSTFLFVKETKKKLLSYVVVEETMNPKIKSKKKSAKRFLINLHLNRQNLEHNHVH